MKGKRLLLLMLFIGGPIVVFSLWITGFINFWFYGIGDIDANVSDYYLELEAIDGEYSVTIDLSEPVSNEGKILYDDGLHEIYVSDVIVQNEANYEVYFRTSGKYNFRGATLVSARMVLLSTSKQMLMQRIKVKRLKYTNLVHLDLILTMGTTSECI